MDFRSNTGSPFDCEFFLSKSIGGRSQYAVVALEIQLTRRCSTFWFLDYARTIARCTAVLQHPLDYLQAILQLHCMRLSMAGNHFEELDVTSHLVAGLLRQVALECPWDFFRDVVGVGKHSISVAQKALCLFLQACKRNFNIARCPWLARRWWVA